MATWTKDLLLATRADAIHQIIISGTHIGVHLSSNLMTPSSNSTPCQYFNFAGIVRYLKWCPRLLKKGSVGIVHWDNVIDDLIKHDRNRFIVLLLCSSDSHFSVLIKHFSYTGISVIVIGTKSSNFMLKNLIILFLVLVLHSFCSTVEAKFFFCIQY